MSMEPFQTDSGKKTLVALWRKRFEAQKTKQEAVRVLLKHGAQVTSSLPVFSSPCTRATGFSGACGNKSDLDSRDESSEGAQL